MSLTQVNAFYELLISEPAIYQEYYNKCCRQGFFGSYHWDKSKIISLAATLGYNFNENELIHLWLEGEQSYSQVGQMS
ncbi:Nif11-like leader peptide family natural product precursor [Fortiea contorta]|uniref:Nif11-like leader peptide family natural product precursor n=1 Tax=Fortiea contorta TaxID=1892405 RepID=UPI0003487F24|nr:Nif11-like leader peptide family natural product precursor [Fortiea contorta]